METGLDRLARNPSIAKEWGRCALVANQASVDINFKPAWQILRNVIGDQLTVLMGPQHGFESTVQDNMIETGHGRHIHTNLPIYSLYSETREPTEEMLAGVDTIVFDLQVTGCRIYTYKYTLASCLRAARKYGKRVVVLDRQNPLGGCAVEGNVLMPDTKSFVGEFCIPMRHGLTLAEAGRLFNASIGAELEIVKLEGWDPIRYWEQYGRQWVLTSPNLPNIDCVYVFPGQVLFEGTNVSEGRGTCLPFLFTGAPFFKSGKELIENVVAVYGSEPDGVVLREAAFQPGFSKWAGDFCQGLQIHVTDPYKLKPFRLGLAILRASVIAGDDAFAWRAGPYEYNYNLLPIELLIGSKKLPPKILSNNFDIGDSCWSDGIGGYIENVKPYLLYEREMASNH